MGKKVLEWMIPVLITLGVSGWVGYSHNDKEITNRVTAVETQQKADDKRLERIEVAVDRVDQKVDRLLERKQ